MFEPYQSLPIRRPQGNVWLHRFALFTAGATLVLILAGGLVTSTGAGLAVPDWPTTFGYNMFLFPWSKMVGDVFVEHGHRLIGAGVGLLTLTLALWLWVSEHRGWLRWLGIIALGAVIVQGVLGGLRVVFLEQTLAIVHAALAQAFFAVAVSLAFFTSREGRDTPQTIQAADAGRLRYLSLLTTSVIYVQLIAGAVLRHTGLALGAHLVFAVLVSIQVFFLAVVIMRGYSDQPRLVQPVIVLSGLLILQLGLGLGSYLGKFTTLAGTLHPLTLVVLSTAHVAIGALMLATCLVLTLRVYRLLVSQSPAGARELLSTHPAGRSEEAPA